ncbi:sulfatase family protein [Chitinophaga barathri]|uniref:Arylsulfatase n=1 Tax=Chitinophaga barathri TaxID=1647451 RepID=A0A3N4MNA0_9BACT|nr:sulfatase [Chitinophaga barathri]RPD41099.1 arylsulfatase [Chitinophaga barathri]
MIRQILAFCLLAATGVAVYSFIPSKAPKPNVVIIFMDDMGYGDPACFGGGPYQTPNLDRLAANGMRFTNFYAAQAVCSASRAGLLTGCYPNRIGIRGALSPTEKFALGNGEETIAELLRDQGYATGMAGKWHLGSKPPFLPLQNGFDSYLGLPYSNDMWPVNYDGVPYADTAKNGRKNYPPLPLIDGNETRKIIRTLEDQSGLTALYTERACSFIRENKKKPFFLYLAHSMPHVPIAVSKKFQGSSGAGLFGDLMQELDASIGEVLKTLEENGLSKNTLVIFTSDNGPWLNYGNHAGSTGGLREGKGTSFEGGQRVPCIMQWPGHIPAGTVTNKVASTIDVLPTVATVCGANLPKNKIDGISILSLLNGEKGANPRDHFVYYYGNNQLEAIRKGNFKLVFPHKGRTYKLNLPGYDGFPGAQPNVDVPLGLYDLSMDPGETLDVQAQFPEVVKDLSALADTYRKTLGDALTNVKGTENREPGKVLN